MESRTPDASPVNRTRALVAEADVDAGRAIVEAVVGLALIAIAVVGWSTATVTATRTVASAEHRQVALQLASNELEDLRILAWDQVGIDPRSDDVVTRFEGDDIVLVADGRPALRSIELDGAPYEIRLHITESGDPSWHRAIVIVSWDDGPVTRDVRLESAVRRDDVGGL